MRFIRKRNLLDGEKLLYTPNMHWFYIIKPLFVSVFVFLCLLVLYAFTGFLSPYWVVFFRHFGIFGTTNFTRNVLLTFTIIILLITIARIISYLYTEYGVTNMRLMIKKGAISIRTAEIPTDRIESIYITQGCLGRVFNYGTVCVSGIGGKEPSFFMVCQPCAVRRKIAEIIEKNKRITVMQGKHPTAAPLPKPGVTEEEAADLYGTFVKLLS